MIRAHGMLCVIKVFIILFLIFIVSDVKAEYEGTWISTDGPYFLKYSFACDFGYYSSTPITWIGGTEDLWWEANSNCYYSTDRGVAWDQTLSNVYVGDIQCLPQSANTVYFIVDRIKHEHSVSYGVYKSTNRGVSWNFFDEDEGLDNNYLTCLDIWDKDGVGDTVFVGAYGGEDGLNGPVVFFTLNGGAHWDSTLTRPTTRGYVRDIIVGPDDHDIVYAAVDSATGGLYRSTDGGDSWSVIFDHSNITNCTEMNCHCMAIKPTDHDKMMVGCQVRISSITYNRIYYCTDLSNSSPTFQVDYPYMDLAATDTIKCILINNRTASEYDTFYVAACKTGFYKRMGSGDPVNSTP